MDITTIVGLIASFTLLTMAMLSGGDVRAFIDVPSALITVGGTLAVFLVSTPLGETVGFLGKLRYVIYFPVRIYANVHPEMFEELGVKRPEPASNEEVVRVRRDLKQGAELLRRIRPFPIGIGALGSLTGVVNILLHLDEPSQIGPGVATAILTLFYGVLLTYLVILPFALKLEARLRSLDEQFW